MKIRNIQAQDNKKIEEIVKSTIVEFGLPTEGSAYEDSDTQNMFEAYQGTNACYFVLEHNNEVIGGGSIKPLRGENMEICELQKMYVLPKGRGKGFGRKLFEHCLQAAKELGYKKCYLESDPGMTAAIRIYEKSGFEHLKGPLGNTGHTACGIWMIKPLT